MARQKPKPASKKRLNLIVLIPTVLALLVAGVVYFTLLRKPLTTTSVTDSLRPHGIIVATPKQNPATQAFDQLTVTAYGIDSISAQRAIGTFPYNSSLNNKLSNTKNNAAIRQLFNADFIKMAVSQEETDGGNIIGYFNTLNKFTNLTPADADKYGSSFTSSYRGKHHQYSPLFNQKDGRIWFSTPENLNSVDPDSGADSSRVEQSEGLKHDPNSRELLDFYIAPTGKPSDLQTIHSSDGKTKFDTTKNLQVNKDTACTPLLFLNNTNLLCTITWVSSIGRAELLEKLAKVTIVGNGQFTISDALLPESNKSIGAVVAAADGEQIAFLARDKTTWADSLYKFNLNDGSEPQLVADLGKTLQPLWLLDWVQ